ncbi:unnamed protein product [Chondrus crispus]|uniref:Putative restriction endonuclease domain-containing protein n=1 Tax=Chondrus crispus TaxID=2769 RepID=R7QP02_CHOCR|nr:unnamed protein product [Chondrus crispus]CDF40232.1 unnamed protein product [Chondrus crispus]|eukprot:XP_005710526.1 unnamed protein product [Chondrus crispus]
MPPPTPTLGARSSQNPPSPTRSFSPLSSPLLSQPPLSLSPTSRPGDLHLLPCTVDQYFDLPNAADNKYELVEGILWWKSEMATHSHDEIRNRVAAEIGRFHIAENLVVSTEMGLETSGLTTPSGSSHNASEKSLRSIRRPDVIVSQRDHGLRRCDLSPQSKKISFPRNHPPLLALEVTSPSTRSADLTSKREEYAKAGVRQYVIIDRATATPAVIVGTLNSNGKYVQETYRGEEIVRGGLLDGMSFSASYYLNPPRDVHTIQNSPIKEKDRQLKEKDRQLKEKDRQLKEKEQGNEELHRQLNKHRAMSKRRKTELEALGISVTESSESPTASPNRRSASSSKRKRN